MAVAQKEAAIWYFGFNAGVDFNSGTPVALTDGALSTLEGCATISDPNGNLLFYTDGITVWNRNHNPMPNGTGLKGDPSSTQSAIIVPKSDEPNIYYIFTVDDIGGPDGLQYNVVDMNLNGGLGDVTAERNIVLNGAVSEKITAVENSGHTGIWVIAKAWESDAFLCYLVGASGVNTTPVVSHAGYTTIPDVFNTESQGYLKASPDGKLLASAIDKKGIVELFRFNAATGTVSDVISLLDYFDNTWYDMETYGLEFSPNSKVLYVGTRGGVSQFDLSIYDQATIVASGLMISPLNTWPPILGALQTGIDGKIYITRNYRGYLNVINNPNVLGMGCNYQEQAVDLGISATGGIGLPPFISSYFYVGIQADNFCLGDTTTFSVNTTDPILNIAWDFGDGNTSSLETPGYTYAAPGDYTVSVTVGTATETSTDTKDITIYALPVANMVSDFEVCSPDPAYEFDLSTKDTEILGGQSATEFSVDYYPTQLDAQNNTNKLPDLYTNTSPTETVYAKIFNPNGPTCNDITSFDLIVKQAPILNTVTDWAICDTDTDGLFDFDLTQKDTEVLDGQNTTIFTVNYFASQSDADNDTNAIGPSYTNTVSPQTIFFRIENTNYPECYSSGSFQLEVITGVVAHAPMTMETCDDDNDGISSFDLTINNNEILGGQSSTSFGVSYYSTQLDADTGTNALNIATGYTNNIPYAETIYARVENIGNPDCYNTTSFELMVHDSPIQQSVSDWQVCDSNNDGIYDFDLSEMNVEILGNQSSTGFTITYYETQTDAMAGQNAIVGPFQNTTSSQDVFYRIENKVQTTCFLTDSFKLQVFDSPMASAPTPMVSCDVNETGTQTFELGTKDIEVLNGQNVNTYAVNYYGNSADADADQNPLSKTAYTNSAKQETIFARIQNRELPSCYDITSFEIMVNPLPQPNIEPTYVICPDIPELVIDAGDFESWSWEDGNNAVIGTGRTMNITELGDYFLSVTHTMNGIQCGNTVPFTVISSGAPDDLTVNVNGFSDKVTLKAEASGTGDFEYSIDGANFQDSDRFEVFPGEYTVFVRDREGCRTLSKVVLALGYQKFFTPNGDGSNEYWSVIGMESFPDSQLFIYDRYGKLLKQLFPTGPGWDGTYNGTSLPSSDYWFQYVYDNGKVFKGHFSLKR